MERRYHLHNNPYLANNPYLHNVGNRYPRPNSSARSTSSWVLWDAQQSSSKKKHSPWCTFLTLLVLFLVILGVLAVAGLALYMGALRLEPVQFFDGSMRLLGDRYSNTLANKTSNSFLDKSRRYQTLLEAVYNKSLLSAAVHEIFISSFASGSLIVFFRIILDRRKIPKTITSVEDTLKTVILQEASSPLSVMNALKIDPKDLLIKRYIEDLKHSVKKEELSTNVPSDGKNSKLTTPYPQWSTISGETASVKTLPSQMVQGSYTVTSSVPKTRNLTKAVAAASTQKPSQRSTTEPPELLFSMKHSPGLKQYLNRETTVKTTEKTKIEHSSEEPWKPMIGQRDFKENVDFDYGIGEAEVIDSPPFDTKSSMPRMKHKPYTLSGIIEEVTKPPKPTGYTEKVAKPIFRSDLIGEQKSMPELSILQQFHDLDALLKSYKTDQPNSQLKAPTVVTLLPVRSNLRGTLRPRPQKLITEVKSNPLHSTTTETVATDVNKSQNLKPHTIESLQTYFETTEPFNDSTTPPPPKKVNSSNVAYVTENLKNIALISSGDQISSIRDMRQGVNISMHRRAKMPELERFTKRSIDEPEMKLDLEQMFNNITTTSRSVNKTKRGYADRIDFSFQPPSYPKEFNLNATQFLLNKLAKLQIATSEINDTKYEKVSNKAVATSFPGNGGSPFRLLTKVLNKIPKNDLSTTTEKQSVCSKKDSFHCDSGECLPYHLKCNKLMDCRDGSDETNCTCADFLRNQYHTRKICDGIFDCWDYSDEQGCDWCSPGQHVCANSRKCVEPSQVCDGFPQCPNGDDEKNCITVSKSLETANDKDYYPSGYVMVRKEGEWGKMCLQNFDNVISKSNFNWSLQDLGQSVCKSLSYKKFDGITKQKDLTPRSVTKSPVYYELILSNDNSNRRSTREKISFKKTACIEKQVAQISCSNLECGIRPEANTPWTNERRSRIVGGGNAGPGSWPWQAALYKEGEFQCGATLISETWLLSAGHCFYNAQNDYWVARLGALRRSTPPAPYEQLKPISQVVLHPEYEDQGFINDISLLRMSSPIILTSFVRPICLPEMFKEPKDDAMCTVVGWGQLFEVGRVFPDTLQEVQLPVISTSECRKRTVFLPLYQVTDNMFCAGYERGGRDACLGDSGGPLMCQESNGRWTLTGVTSNGYGCARANRPGVYTKVVNYLPWVEETIFLNIDNTINMPPECNGHRCPLGECLPPARLCNGYIECRDSSDEMGCW